MLSSVHVDVSAKHKSHAAGGCGYLELSGCQPAGVQGLDDVWRRYFPDPVADWSFLVPLT